MTGVDLSESMLGRAREKAREAGVVVDFSPGDARHLTFRGEFDLVIMLCEGGFPLMETDAMNFQILQSADRALKPGGEFIFTTLNGLFPLFHSVRDFLNAHESGGTTSGNTFDLMTFRDHATLDFVDDDGNPHRLQTNERYYVPTEITWLLRSLDFQAIDIFGCTIGAFSRNDPLTTNDFEMLVVTQKKV